ncbi:MAG: hypothetical protein IJU23_02700 [Proteobacteria bacterium]|nr:hypothetical protein [Pseudomonadota bacterium]
MISYHDDFTAEEALEFALNHDDVPEADPGTPGFETAVLCRCLDRFQIPEESHKPFSKAVMRIMRPLAGRTITSEIMADTAREVAARLIQFAESRNADETVMAAIQITTALLSLLHKHELYEKRLRALEELDTFGLHTETLRSLLAASEPTTHPELVQLRLNREKFRSDQATHLPAAEAWLLTNEHIPDNDFILNYQSFTSQIINDLFQNFPQYVNTFLHAPHDWTLAQYAQMNELSRHALWLTMAKKRALNNQPEIEEGNFESWLRNEAANTHAARQWLDNRVPSGHGTLARVFTALHKRENADTNWYAGWLRDIDSEFPADNDTFWENTGHSWNDFETYWLAEAWRSSNSRHKAVAMLQERLAGGSESPQLWILLADILVDLQNFGLAEHAIEHALETAIAEDLRIRQAIEITRRRLGKEALKSAKKAHDIEPALLELAMKYGNPETISEAALCAFDSACEPVDIIAKALSETPQARALFIQTLADRRDMDHLDESYHLCDALEKHSGNVPEIRFFEAVCQLDNPPVAAQTLEQVLRHLNDTECIYWSAVDLWIDLMASQNAWYEAISGIATAFASPNPKAVLSLMRLIARLPRDARPMMQSILFETIGPEQTKQIFDRARNPVPTPETRQNSTLDIQSLGLSMMPVFWQMLHRVARLNPPPTMEESARAARRETVLAARGLATSKYEKAPEPAAWVHNTISKASDAFHK